MASLQTLILCLILEIHVFEKSDCYFGLTRSHLANKSSLFLFAVKA